MRLRLANPALPPSIRLVLLVLVLGACPNILVGAAPRVLPAGQRPADRRLGELKDLNGHFPFEVPATLEAWESRAASLKRRILVATGLWPMPTRTPPRAVVHGRVEREGFTVEKVYLESVPGHYVTGLLFKPSQASGKLPAVLCPHGHGGRLQDLGEAQIKNYINQGAERFEASGRFPKLARCAQLARMGCVTFIYDMLGYADSVQIPSAVAHGFAKQRPELDRPDRWGFFSTQAELRLQSIMGLQTYNSIRALDWLSQLPEVDAQRIGVTGGSGGGTQTILLCAIDSRPVVAFPQGMVSTSMQGGCTCENCSLLRIGTGNVELAALFAPRPQAMTAANDWTKEMMTDGFPQLRQVYAMFGARDQVLCTPLLHFPHNYNYVTRGLMYGWFNRHLKLGLPEPIVEEDYELLSPEEYTVWDGQHPRPEGGVEHELAVTRWLDQDSRQQMEQLRPSDAATWKSYRQVVGGAWETLIDRGLSPVEELERKKVSKEDRGTYWQFGDLLTQTRHGEQLPMVSLYPKQVSWNKRVVIWIGDQGKQVLFDASGEPTPEVRQLLRAGTAVLAADLVHQGEFLEEGLSLKQAPVVKNPREFAGYTFGYNHTVFAQRVHDILTLISFARQDEHGAERVDLLAAGAAAPLAAAAAAVAGDAVGAVAVNPQGFRFGSLSSYRDPLFIPGAVKYGDLPGLLALSAGRKLWIAGETKDSLADLQAAAHVVGAADQIRLAPADAQPSDAVEWLVR